MVFFSLQVLLSLIVIIADLSVCHLFYKRFSAIAGGVHREKDTKQVAWRAFFISLNAHMFCLLFVIFFLHKYVYRWDFYKETFLIYVLAFIFITEIIYLLRACFRQYFTELRPAKWNPYSNFLFAILGACLLGTAGFFFFVSTWMHNFFGKIAPDQLLFTIVGGGAGDATADTNAQVANYIVTPVVISAILGAETGLFHVSHRSEKSRHHLIKLGVKRGLSCLLSFVLFVSSAIYMCRQMPIVAVVKSQFGNSSFIEKEYVDPFDVVSFPDKPRNFIHILMESTENSYYSKELGGYDERNLMPELAELNEDSLHFSQKDTLGGPHQTYGASHSVAGMMNLNAGMPMKTDILAQKDLTMDYPDFVITIGDLLASQGYNNYFMLGSDSTWGDLDKWYKAHGNFEIFDLIYAKKMGYLPENYKVWWGFEDDKLYMYAKEQLTRLAEAGKPFYFVLENADTHFPDGYVSENMKDKPYREQYANVIHYSQAEVVKLVDWIKQQDFYENTTILITGDHRSMDKNFFKGWDPAYERTIVNMYINPAVPMPNRDRMYKRDFAPFDLFATSLAVLGIKIEGDRAGLGTNLLSEKKTLLEEYGQAYVDEQLLYPSDFYNSFRRSDEEKEKINRNLGNEKINKKIDGNKNS